MTPASTSLSLSPQQWAARRGVVPSIDGVRALSVILVLLGHVVLPHAFIGVSALGLKIFFLISGFLITRLLLAEFKADGKISLSTFYVRRFLRLYPVLIAYVSVTAAAAAICSKTINMADIASVFAYFVNYRVIYLEKIHADFTLPIQMLWSLSIEEHFYLMAPLITLVLARRPQRIALWACAVCIACLALRYFYAWKDPSIVYTLEIYWRSETRFDCIAYGVLLASLTEFRAGRGLIEFITRMDVAACATAILLASFAIRSPYFQNTLRFSIQGVALMIMLATVVFSQKLVPLNIFLNSSPMRWIGALSYSIYVWHGSFDFFWPQWSLNLDHSQRVAFQLIFTLAAATTSYYLLERPISKWRGTRHSRPALTPSST